MTICSDQSITDTVQSAAGIVLVARGGLPYINTLSGMGLPIWVCWGSRLESGRSFRWVIAPPGELSGRKIVLFDRSVTTGGTVLAVNRWLKQTGADVFTIGQLDPLCRLGLMYVDAVAEKTDSGELMLITRDEFVQQGQGIGGCYTFIINRQDQPAVDVVSRYNLPVIELPAIDRQRVSVRDLAGLADREPDGDVAVVPGDGWDVGNLLIYTHVTGKPAMFIGPGDGCDGNWCELDAMLAWLCAVPEGGRDR